tara:strand:- start:1869 stop:2825 length:957 start_codon:yes stop_codon:yes gene_type:complete
MSEIIEYCNFDEADYAQNNIDLKKALLKTNNRKPYKERLWRHWCVYGRKEGRKYCKKDMKETISKENFENEYVIFITRNMRDSITAEYWKINYHKIRKHYKTIKIIIIDDNSIEDYIKNDDIEDVEYIYTEHKGRGEILPYYYYLKDSRERKYGLMIHDSVFLEGEIHKYITKKDYIPLWHFLPETEIKTNRKNIKNIIQESRDRELLMKTFNECNWRGMFGSMSIISHELLKEMNEKFDIFNILMKNIKVRNDRKALERILPLCLKNMNINTYSSLLGNIHHWCKMHYGKFWDLNINEYNNSNIKNECLITKIWTGR